MQTQTDSHNPDAVNWNNITSSLSNPSWEPTSEDVREALRDTIDYFSRGKLNQDELTWALSFLAGRMVEIELKGLFDSLGHKLGEESRLAKRGY